MTVFLLHLITILMVVFQKVLKVVVELRDSLLDEVNDDTAIVTVLLKL